MRKRLDFGTFFAPGIVRNRKSKIAIIAISLNLESSIDRDFFFGSPINRDRKSKLFFLRFRTLWQGPPQLAMLTMCGKSYRRIFDAENTYAT